MTTSRSRAPITDAEPDACVNTVLLRGRLASPAEKRVLPSGDVLLAFRLTVDRPPGDRVKVDSIDCAAELARVRRVVARAKAGAVVEVEGSLQRRFYRVPGGTAGSRYQVKVTAARVVTVGRRGDA